jgi:HK97 family phage major capsid protein
MELIKARQLREQRMKLVTDARALVEKTEVTAEDRSNFDRMMGEADGIKADIDRLERLDAADQEHRGAPPSGRLGALNEMKPEERQKMALRSYLINGFERMPAELRDIMVGAEKRDMGTGGGNALTGTGGGYLVPVGMASEIETAMKFYGPMVNGDIITMFDTSTGAPLPYPTSNDTTVSGEQVDEHTQVSVNDISIGNVNFDAYQFSTKMIKVSRQLLQDSAFSFEAFINSRFAERLGRIVNTKATTGSGSSTINGIITAATSSGVTAAGSATNSGGAETGTTTIGSDDLLDLIHSVDIVYRQGAMFMMHDTTLKVLKKVKDKYGRPLWQPGVATREPDTIEGYGYAVNNDMAAIATGVKSVLFGQLKKYMLRRVKELEILRLSERYAEFGQVAFIGFARYDGDLIDAGTHPVKYITQL